MAPRVLAVGIQHSSRRSTSTAISKQRSTVSQTIPARLRSKIRSQVSTAKAAGFDLEMLAAKPGQLDSDLKRIHDKLEKEKPDLFIIGFGIRGSTELTPFFEKLITTCREASPTTKIGFNTTFDGNIEVCERNLGKQKQHSDDERNS